MPFVSLTTSKKFEEHVRQRFKEWFEESGQSQREAGEPIEWEQQTVSAYFRGEQQIDFPRAVAWCKHFNKNINELLQKAPTVAKPVDPGLEQWTSYYTRRPPQRRKQLLSGMEEMERGGRGR
jgi:DNA-binding XRE family transcriptional regulator